LGKGLVDRVSALLAAFRAGRPGGGSAGAQAVEAAEGSADDIEAAVRGLSAADGSTCLGDERLLAFYANRLSGAEEEAFRAHLASCRSCLKLTADVRRFLEAMGAGRGDGFASR
jgi:hypothetical protein